MRVGARGPGTAAPTQLVEVVTPRTNGAIISPSENFLAGVSLKEPFSLEIAATRDARWFLVRAGSRAMREHLEEELGAAYPQAELRPLDISTKPYLDPATPAPGEQVVRCALALRAPEYLPLRTFRDVEVAAERSPQADPILGILGALGNLPPGWRGLSQLVLRPTSDDWSRPYLRYAAKPPIRSERAYSEADTSLASVFGLGALLVLGTLGYEAYHWYLSGAYLPLALLALGGASSVPGLLWLGRKLGDRPANDVRLVQELVQEKVLPIAYASEIRLAVFAEGWVPSSDVRARLDRLAAAYRQYNLAAGNGFVPVPLGPLCSLGHLEQDPRSQALAALADPFASLPLGESLAAVVSRLIRGSPPGAAPRMVLNTRELAALWHLPQAGADVSLLERTDARRVLPLAVAIREGCRIGRSSHQGRSFPICLPDDLLRKNALLVAKTRRGKSTLMLRLSRYLMEEKALPRPALVLVDPHRDLARAALGLVPERRREDVVYLDLADVGRPFGLNLLDAGLGWDRDKAVSNCLTVFRNEFDRFWGPRMEDAFRFALLTLFEANESYLSSEIDGRSLQHTILDVPALLSDAALRKVVLESVADPVVRSWWDGYYRRLDPRLQLEVINPVLTKVQRFSGSRVGRRIVGQSRSTIEPAKWLREGSIVLVSTASGVVGADVSSLIGTALVNIVALVAAEQSRLEPERRRPLTLVVDEFHCFQGADYELVLSELAKQGANLILATQSLARLDVLDSEHRRALRELVFANIDSLFAFQTSAEDARFLARELGGSLTESDIIELPDFHCYARLSADGKRLPTFSVELDPPSPSAPTLRDELVEESRLRFGRAAEELERELALARERMQQMGERARAQLPGRPGSGVGRELWARHEERTREGERGESESKDGGRPSGKCVRSKGRNGKNGHAERSGSPNPLHSLQTLGEETLGEEMRADSPSDDRLENGGSESGGSWMERA